jgi:hypothetical protein
LNSTRIAGDSAAQPFVESAVNLTRNQLAAVFNEWAIRYADNPDAFGEILDDDGIPIEDYGDRCVAYLEKVAEEMEGSGVMPPPVEV